jgi:hypothetical protein
MSRESLRLETSLLGGQEDDPKARRIAELEAELRQARREAIDAEVEANRAREDSNRALSMLRQQLGPLYRALQAVFGEIDAAGIPETGPGAPAANTVNERVSPVWAAWKEKLSPACGKVIDALLVHKDLNRKQICVAAQMGKDTMYGVITKLKTAGLLDENGGRFSLKQL